MRLPIRLAYVLLISNVTLRFFTDDFDVLPRAFNVLDIGITAWLAIMCLLSRKTPVPSQSPFPSLTRRLILFNIVLCVGALLNGKAFYLPAAISQCIMLS